VSLVEISNLSAYYLQREKRVRAVDGIDIRVESDEILGIAGESGCGKSTLLKTIYGYVEPPLYVEKGEVSYNFSDFSVNNIFSLSNLSSIKWKKISYITQGSMNALNPVQKVHRFFLDLWKAHGQNLSLKDFEELLRNRLSYLGLPEEVLERYPHQLSGGMKQRIVIAASSLFNPEVILADEPTSALDVGVQLEVLGLFMKIQKESKNTIIIVSHDMSVLVNLCSRVAVMYAGNIVEVADTRSLFKNPLHPYTKLLIESLPKIGGDRELRGIPGTPPDLAFPPSGCKFHPRCPFSFTLCAEENPILTEVYENHQVACHLSLRNEEVGAEQ